MPVQRDKPYAGMNFLVDIGTGQDGPDAGVAEVVFPEARLQVDEYRTGNGRTHEPGKLASLTHYGNLVLRRGVIGSLSWYHWWNDARNGGRDLRTVTVQLLDERHEPVLAWRFLRAQPVAYLTSPMNAAAAATLFETLEIAFDRFEME